VKIDTDDAAMIVIRYEGGARGVMSTSQINMGRKNSLQWDVAGSKASAAWDSETPDHLFIGHRDAPNQVLMRDFTLMNADRHRGGEPAAGPCGGLRRQLLRLLPRGLFGRRGGRAAGGSTWATFEDGHLEMVFCDAVLRSAQEGRWVRLDEI
jgi:predicted dehydrogenase